MFFVLSKLLDVVLDPLWWGLVASGLGLVLGVRGRRRAGVVCSLFGLLMLTVFSLPAVAARLWFALEADAPNTFRPSVTYDAVVLLGGVVDTAGSLATEPSYGTNIDRLLTVYDLLRTDKARAVILSGGPLSPDLPTEAVLLQRQLISWGISPDRIVLEEHSKNTRENAVETAAVAKAQHFTSLLVVTSAFHMQRAQGCFVAVGLPVDVLPVDYRIRRPEREAGWLPRAELLAESTRALRELSGRWVYRVLGYSNRST